MSEAHDHIRISGWLRCWHSGDCCDHCEYLLLDCGDAIKELEVTDLITRLEEAERAATPGKWVLNYGGPYKRLFESSGIYQKDIFATIKVDDEAANSELVILMRNSLPLLLELARAAEELKAVHAKVPLNMYGDYSKRQDMIDAMGTLFLRLAKLKEST